MYLVRNNMIVPLVSWEKLLCNLSGHSNFVCDVLRKMLRSPNGT